MMLFDFYAWYFVIRLFIAMFILSAVAVLVLDFILFSFGFLVDDYRLTDPNFNLIGGLLRWFMRRRK